MSNLAGVLASARAKLKSAGTESCRLEARVLAAQALGVSPEDILTYRGSLATPQIEQLDGLVARRASGEPLAYIVGKKEFFGLEFEVGPGVLVPRPETETLVEEALRDFPEQHAPLRILDLGTGSGCLLMSLLKLRPAAMGVGIERSADALFWARHNRLRHGLEHRCELRQADWNDGISGAYDIILTNPPYIGSGELSGLAVEVRLFEPPCALDGGQDGLEAFRQIVRLFPRVLRPGGAAYMEIGQGQHYLVGGVVEAAGLRLARITKDLAGIPRCMVVGLKGDGLIKKRVGNKNPTR